MEYHVKCVGVNGFKNILFLSILFLCSNKYYNILVASILITLFSKMLKFLENIFVKESKNLCEYFIFWHGIFNFNWLFDKHAFKLLLSYDMCYQSSIQT